MKLINVARLSKIIKTSRPKVTKQRLQALRDQQLRQLGVRLR